ncbi:MAG: MFS transporter [Clostridia bacterium]|nr:MFS transporter [Clostridia bacterium]
MKTKNRTKFFLTLVIFSLTGQIAWVVENMYFNVFIYKMFGASAADISAMVAASAVAATLTTLLIGALSDKLGKRKVFICGGYILWGISILSFCFIREDFIGAIFPAAASVSAVCVTLVIIMDCVMTFFGSSANDACFNAWLTDVTDDTNRGAAEGINSMMPLVAILAVFGGFMSFDLGKSESWTAIFAIIGAAVIVIGVAGFFLITEPKLEISQNKNYFANIFYGFRPSVVRENKKLYVYLLAFAVFGVSIQIFMPYLILYYTVSLRMDNYVFIMAPAIILAAVFTAFWGRVYDKVKFKKSVFPALMLLMLGYVLLYFFRGTVLVFIGSLMMMCGYLAGAAVFGAVIRDNTPENRAGMFQGLRIVGQVLLPGIIGPAIGAKILENAEKIINDDGTASFVPNQNIFLASLAVAAALCVFLLVVFKLMESKGENKNGK